MRTANAASYFVDFSAGSDAANGTSVGTPWKHSPGDPNATGTAAATDITSGTVNFKGGVIYRGAIRGAKNGVTYEGSAPGFGSGAAVFSGFDVVASTWTNCTSAGDCWGNTNFANIWRTGIPGGITNTLTLFSLSNAILPFAQSPTPTDAFHWTDWANQWHVIPVSSVTLSNLTDATWLTNAGATFFSNAWIGLFINGDNIDILPITNYIPASHQIGYPPSDPLPVTTTYYSILNQPYFLSGPGQSAIRPDEDRVYIWCPDGGNPNSETVEYTRLPMASAGQAVGFWMQGLTNITIDGFKFTGQQAPFLNSSQNGGTSTNYAIQNCEFTCGRDITPIFLGNSAVHEFAISWEGFPGAGGLMVSNCNVHDTQMGGILGGGWNVSVINSTVARIDSWNYSGIYYLGVTQGVISNNLVHAIYGVHVNGITSYASGSVLATNIVFARNIVYDCPSVTCCSIQSTYNLTIENNLMDGGYVAGVLEDFNGLGGYLNIWNNDFVRGQNNNGLALISTGNTVTMANNIISGGVLQSNNVARSNNVYVDLAFFMPGSAGYGWTNGPGEVIQTNYNAVFVSTNGPLTSLANWTLVSGSPAIGAGTNLSALFTLDVAGNTRAGSPTNWDIGAYSSSPPPPPPPPPPSGPQCCHL